MNGCNSIPPLVIAGFITTVLSFVLHLAGYVTSYWLAWFGENETHIGLWERCDHIKHIYNNCVNMSAIRDYSGMLTASQILESLALVAYVAAVVCATLHSFVVKQRSLFIVGAITNCIAGSIGLIGCIIFCTIRTVALDHLHFSFAFCVVAGIGGIVSGVLFIRAWKPGDLSLYEQFSLKTP
ncbi:uncharacterized protein LOC134710167 [Mytilus trossulus]|uniref:uncharacterized protein LOC134710167 n=1 Tax=Mytilus trossulus TaxID=6551 RepID=UPI00300460D5